MKNVIIINKEIGETPLECLERARVQNEIPESMPMTYAGRLDPMAEGALLLLVGEECKKKEEYLKFDKEYEVEILYGIQTDTFDVLGMIKKVDLDVSADYDFSKYICKFNQEYPTYSSRVISMKDVPEELPQREVEIYSINILEKREAPSDKLVNEIIEKIKKVKGEFRQRETSENWLDFSKKYAGKHLKIVKINVKCGSGTYMRSLAQNMGGLAFSIKRTRIGDYQI